MSKRVIDVVIILSALAALGLSILTVTSTSRTAPVRADTRQAQLVRTQLDALSKRILQLEQNAGLRVAGTDVLAIKDLPQIDERLDRLKAQLEQIELAARPLYERSADAHTPTRSPDEANSRKITRLQALRECRDTFLDRQATNERRLAALDVLRRGSPRTDLRDEVLVAASIELLNTSMGGEQKAKLLRALKGVKSDALAAKLVTELESAPNAEVREEAAETLSSMLDHARVLAALERAAKGDTSQRVRKQARATLRGDG